MHTDSVLPPDLAALVDAEMGSGERVVWLGRPIPSRFARMSLGRVLFGIPWTAFALFWIAGASGFKRPDFSRGFSLFALIWGIPFVLIGLWMLSSPIWMLRKATRTAYVITDKRALVVEAHTWRGGTVRSLEPDCLTDLRRTQYRDGSGNLVFARGYSNTGPSRRNPTDVGFFAIPDVKVAEDRIRELVHEARIHKA